METANTELHLKGEIVKGIEKEGCAYNFCKVPKGDHEGRPYISSRTGTTCRGDPRGRPASPLRLRLRRTATTHTIAARLFTIEHIITVATTGQTING